MELEDERIVLKGPNVCETLNEYAPKPYGFGNGALGYVLNAGIPRDKWERWLSVYGSTLMVRNKLVFAANSQPRAIDEAKELASGGIRSGLEPVDISSISTIRKRVSSTRIPSTGQRLDAVPFEGVRQ